MTIPNEKVDDYLDKVEAYSKDILEYLNEKNTSFAISIGALQNVFVIALVNAKMLDNDKIKLNIDAVLQQVKKQYYHYLELDASAKTA